MSGAPETLVDIAAEIRHGERMFWSLRDCAAYADRIEAAAERERVSAPVNAAAMREALEAIDKNTDLLDIAEGIAPKLHPSHSFVAVQIRKIVRAALSAPARNADRFKTAVEAMEEWGKYPQSRYKGCRVCPHGDASMVSPSHLTLAEWLFVPAEK